MAESVKKAAAKPQCEVLWASTRELLNIYQAESVGCQIITVPNGILAKRKNVGKDSWSTRSTPLRVSRVISKRLDSTSCRNRTS